MNTTANNVANVNSEGYVPTDTKVVGDENSITTNVRKADDNGSKISQTDLSKEMTDQIITQGSTAVNVAAIRAHDEMLGSLLDTKA
jgi:flagellar hook protein FlgE